MSFLLTKAHQDDVCGQAVQPGREGRLAAEGVNFAEELEEGFLREVFGLEGIADHAKAETVDAAGVLAVEMLERGSVATLGAADGGIELCAGRLEWAGLVRELFHLVVLDAAELLICCCNGVAGQTKACHRAVITMSFFVARDRGRSQLVDCGSVSKIIVDILATRPFT